MLKINAELIRKLLFERRLSLRQFALKAGLNPTTAAKVIKDGTTVTTKTVADIVRFFGVDGNSLILAEK